MRRVRLGEGSRTKVGGSLKEKNRRGREKKRKRREGAKRSKKGWLYLFFHACSGFRVSGLGFRV